MLLRDRFGRICYAPNDGGSAPAPAPAVAPAAPSSAPEPSPAPTPGGASSPAPVAAPGRADSLGLDPNIQAIMRFDPFAGPEPTPVQEPASPAPATPAAVGGAPAPAPTAPAAPAAATGQPGADPTGERIARLEDELAALRAPVAPAQPAQPAQPTDLIPAYDFNLPPQLLALLNSENPEERAMGIKNVMRGTARAVHQLVIAEVAQTLPVVVNMMIQQAQTAAEVKTKFYGKYPALNTAELRPLVQQTAAAVIGELQPQAWTDELNDRIAQRVYQVLRWPVPGTVPQAPRPAPAPQILPGGARPAPASADISDEILALQI